MLKIEITTERGPDIGSPSDQVAEALAAIGYIRQGQSVQQTATVRAPELSISSTAETDKTAAESVDAGEPEKGKRGRKPKTDKAASSAATDEAPAEQPQISTGEERIGPQDDPPEVQAQDAADEAAEADDGRIKDMPDAVTLTHDDLRRVMGQYVTKYGVPATNVDGPNIFKGALGEVPQGLLNKQGEQAQYWSLTLVPDTQEALRAAVDAWTAAFEGNPYKRDAVDG